MSALLLVTGTDTGIGKTFVTATMAAALAASGVRVAVAKPVETGCRLKDGRLYPEDAATLAGAAGTVESLEALCSHRFPDALAPMLAAERAGRALDVEGLCAELRARAAAADVLLIEGAGGLLVPITRTATFADLAAALEAAVVLVVGSRLGALNHTLLTLEVLSRRGITTRGYILNRVAGGADLAAETNGGALRGLTRVPCLGELPWLEDAPALLTALRGGGAEGAAAREQLAALARARLDLARIYAG